MQKSLPEKLSQEIIYQLTKEELVELVIRQQEVIEKLNKKIAEIEQEVERLKASRDLDSKTSSKPPSTDILKKSEQKPEENEAGDGKVKRKPGG